MCLKIGLDDKSSKVTNNTKISKIFKKFWILLSRNSLNQKLEDKTANEMIFVAVGSKWVLSKLRLTNSSRKI